MIEAFVFSEEYFADLPPKKIGGIPIDFPDNPSNITFLLLNHSAENTTPPDIERLLADSGIVLLEGPGWNADQAASLNLLSSGDETRLAEHEFARSNFRRSLGRALLGSGKVIAYCDRPYSRKFVAEVQEVNKAPALHKAANVPHGVNIVRDKYRTTYQSVLGRDKYIIKNLYTTISEAQQSNGSEPTKALFVIGGGHVALPWHARRQATQQGVAEKHAINEVFIPDEHTYQLDLYREFLAGKPFSEELLLKDMLVRVMRRREPQDYQMIADLDIEEARDSFDEFVLRQARINAGLEAI